MRSEAEIIERIRKWLPSRAQDRPWLRLGVGDDAAVLLAGSYAASGKEADRPDWVLSCDQFLEDVHFLGGIHPPEIIGYKALARATSDLAAMGAAPRFFMLSLALPASRTGKWLDGFLKGIALAARKFEMVVIGGDTSRFPKVAVNLTVGGQAIPRRTRSGSRHSDGVLTRAGARRGDSIYVTGRLGAAQIGLELVLRGLVRKTRNGLTPLDPDWRPFLETHLRPKIHLALGRWLAGENTWRIQIASAAIDISDGLSTDLGHICRASGVGTRIWANKVPTVPFDEKLRCIGLDPMKLALHGGEDYQLLFTVPARTTHYLPKTNRGVKITKIGEIVDLTGPSLQKLGKPQSESSRKSRIELIDEDGSSSLLMSHGWDPFRTRR
ncbi:MAG TPA: thiamine-phosphate kinase [Candidatus Acidoferrales bacterium]|nr:thiamine-phosphate kinase [Candidatus Acidoferrales bacterium]